MYNQPTQRLPDGRVVGVLYKNPIDCLWKTLKAEGPLGLYKGALLLRMLKQTVLLTLLQAPPHTSCGSLLIRE